MYPKKNPKKHPRTSRFSRRKNNTCVHGLDNIIKLTRLYILSYKPSMVIILGNMVEDLPRGLAFITDIFADFWQFSANSANFFANSANTTPFCQTPCYRKKNSIKVRFSVNRPNKVSRLPIATIS